MASTEVHVQDNRDLRRIEARVDDEDIAGFAAYQIGIDGDVFEFTHTEVEDRFEGQGIGSRLAAGVMDFVRGEGATIVPTCSFIRSYMEEHAETHDLLAEGASLGDRDGDGDDQDGIVDSAATEDEPRPTHDVDRRVTVTGDTGEETDEADTDVNTDGDTDGDTDAEEQQSSQS